MFLKNLMARGKKEREVIDSIRKHIGLLCAACETFHTAFETADDDLMRGVRDLEREGDIVRREIISHIYEGAFLPYLRPDLCRFVETVDRVFDLIEAAAFDHADLKIPEELRGEFIRVAFLNTRICDMLRITFETMLVGGDLREKTLAIRIYEKQIDDIKYGLIRDVRKIPMDDFWKAHVLADFLTGITEISNIIEDAGDYIQIIDISMR